MEEFWARIKQRELEVEVFHSSQNKENNLKFVAHFQKFLAFQQLSMERYNDAFAAAVGWGEPKNEAFLRPTALLNDPEPVAKYIIPALKEKVAIFGKIETEHKEIGEPVSNDLKKVYREFSKFLHVMKERAQLQMGGFLALVNSPDVERDLTRLDNAELQAMDKAILSLSRVVGRLGLSRDNFFGD